MVASRKEVRLLQLAREIVQLEQELAMREALGASRGRIFRQLLAESGVLGAAATVVGVGLAFLSSDLLRQLLNYLRLYTNKNDVCAIDCCDIVRCDRNAELMR